MIDIYSRYIVGVKVQTAEPAVLAAEMMTETLTILGTLRSPSYTPGPRSATTPHTRGHGSRRSNPIRCSRNASAASAMPSGS